VHEADFFGLWRVLWATRAARSRMTAVTMQLNWHPQADFGGYFAAKAEGPVTRRPGSTSRSSPAARSSTIHQLARRRTSGLRHGHFGTHHGVRTRAFRIVAVGAFYQKDPVTFMVHADSGYNQIADLKGKPIYLPGIARLNYWPWLRSSLGFSDEQIRPYDSSLPGTDARQDRSEPGLLDRGRLRLQEARHGGQEPLARPNFAAWNPYSSTLDTTDRFIAEKPRYRAFLKATAEATALSAGPDDVSLQGNPEALARHGRAS